MTCPYFRRNSRESLYVAHVLLRMVRRSRTLRNTRQKHWPDSHSGWYRKKGQVKFISSFLFSIVVFPLDYAESFSGVPFCLYPSFPYHPYLLLLSPSTSNVDTHLRPRSDSGGAVRCSVLFLCGYSYSSPAKPRIVRLVPCRRPLAVIAMNFVIAQTLANSIAFLVKGVEPLLSRFDGFPSEEHIMDSVFPAYL